MNVSNSLKGSLANKMLLIVVLGFITTTLSVTASAQKIIAPTGGLPECYALYIDGVYVGQSCNPLVHDFRFE